MYNYQEVYQQYQDALSTSDQKAEIYAGIGIGHPNRYSDLKNYIPLLDRKEPLKIETMTDFEMLDLLREDLKEDLIEEANRQTSRKNLIKFVKSKTSKFSVKQTTKSSLVKQNSSTKPIDSEYDKCLKEAEKKKLSLCHEGYCTAKMKFEVYPSAYANAYAAQVCKGTKPDFQGRKIDHYQGKEKPTDSSLDRWFKEEWVNVCEPGYPPCGRSKAKTRSKDYPYCRPLNKLPGTQVKTVGELTPQELKEMCKTKRSLPQGVEGEPTRVYVSDLKK